MAMPLFNLAGKGASDTIMPDSIGTMFPGNQTSGSNQYSSYPMSAPQTPGNTPKPAGTPVSGTPGVGVPPAPPLNPGTSGSENRPNLPPGHYLNNVPGSYQNLGGGNISIPTFDPNLTNNFFQMLMAQMGKGATPFNLQTLLPSGGTTQAGQLSAPLNSIDTQLKNFYSTGKGGPAGSDTMQQFSQGINTLPEFQAMQQSMNGPLGPVAQQEAQMRGQFAKSGALAGSEYGNSEAAFRSQTAADQNALMAQLQMQGLGMQQTASKDLMSGAQAFGQGLQGMDQQAIQNQLQEFIRTRPEYSPFLNMLFGASTSSPGVVGKSVGVGATGAAIGSAGSILQGVADLWGSYKGNSSTTPINATATGGG